MSETFAQFMGARDQGSPAKWRTEQEEFNTYPGWSEYDGPMPGPNEMSNGQGEVKCSNCNGTGHDPTGEVGEDCRACGGDGVLTPTTTARDPEVARHKYPSTQTKVPFMGSIQTGAGCPWCGSGTTLHASSKRGQALWGCPSHGVLANLDAHPEVNPYAPPGRARLARMTRTGSSRASAKVMPMLATVHEANEGLSVTEALSLVLATIRRYPEGR